jgi:hypothetical protein
MMPVIFALTVAAAVSAHASFEIKSVSPAERGAATHLALGMVEGSLPAYHSSLADSTSPLALRVYGFRPFGLEATELVAGWALVPVARDLSLGLSYQKFAAVSYAEQTILLGCSWRLGGLLLQPGLRFGIVSLDGDAIDWAVLADAAMEARVASRLKIFAGTHNPFASGLRAGGGRCPTDVTVGLGYLVSPSLGWGIGITKDAGFAASVASGVEVRPFEGVFLRSGLRTEPQEFCLGLGVRVKGVGVDASTSLNPDVGITHEVGLEYMLE